MSVTNPDRSAVTSAPISAALALRWSPRSFRPDAEVTDAQLVSVFEAARWSPSAFNAQPWKFLAFRRDAEPRAELEATLIEFNQLWATNASVLVLGAARTVDSAGEPVPTARYDLGQAVAHLSHQATDLGLYVHQMSGFDATAATARFLPEGWQAVSVIALGHLAPPAALPSDALRERESAPRERKPLGEVVEFPGGEFPAL